MKRILIVLTGVLVLGLLLHIDSDSPSHSDPQPLREGWPGVFIMNPQRVYATDQSDCAWFCLPAHPWVTFAWSVFRVSPKYWTTPTAAPAGTPTATPRALSWQEHNNGNLPPVVIKVSWGGSWETLEIAPNHTTSGSSNIILHETHKQSCDGGNGATRQNLDPGGAPCVSSVDFDIDWKEKVNGNQWDWIYFWVRDPDFVAMKAVDTTNCPTGSWPYEYVNRGPLYSICQSFSNLYQRVHGIGGINVTYDVLYQEGAPPSPTSGATTTPPVPVTPTPCSGTGC
ncbi:MAG: hypothetical protein ABI604_00945 [Nitrospirota bacterium]